MPIIKVTAADLAKTLNLETGWYGAQVVKVHPPSKSSGGDSVNYKMTFLIEHPSKKEIDVTYNSKLMGKVAEPYFAAFGKVMGEGEFDMDLFLGKKMDVKVQPVVYNGNLIDNITAYLAHGKGKEGSPF